ncbi:serine hydrolase [bacterium]|nr:serine hydrolase [bacterium]NUN45172.1 serine hydrolase [bacterium]
MKKICCIVWFISSIATAQSRDAQVSELDSLIQSALRDGFHGLVWVESNDKPIYYKGFGFANESNNQKFDSTVFVQIGSTVKDFTRVAIYQLVEKRKLSLNDPLSKYMPGLAGEKNKITVQHLLNHTAGFPMGIKFDAEPLTKEEMVEHIRGLNLLSSPGVHEKYSNLGYSCLAYVIEKISGRSFDAYVDEYILKPLGMHHTGTYRPNFDRNKIAHGYRQHADIGIILDMPHDQDGHLWSLRGNGGYLSTFRDMKFFFDSFETDKLLSTPAFRMAVYDSKQPTVLAGSDMISFYGFANFPGIKARLMIASNHDNYMGHQLLESIEGYLRNGKNPMGKVIKTVEVDSPGESAEVFDLPKEGAGLTIRRYVEAFNSGNANTMKAFFENYAKSGDGFTPMERRLQNYNRLFSDLGVITVSSFQTRADGSWEVHVGSAKAKAIFNFQIETKAPWRFEALQIELGD